MAEEILRSGFAELVAGAQAAITESGTAADTLRALLRDGVRFMMANELVGTIIRNESRALEQQPRFGFVTEQKRALRDGVVGVLERGVRDGEFRDDIEVETVYYLISDALMGAVRYAESGDRTSDDVARSIGDLLVRGLLP